MSFIIYEQPLNEHVRVCLRLEHLFIQLQHWLPGVDAWDSRSALAALLEILNVLDRPDLKAKLVKELGRYSAQLNRFAQTPGIDQGKLTQVLRELESTAEHLHTMQGRIAQNLRDNDFLIGIRQHITNPSGGCSFDAPAYHYWIHQPAAERIAQLTQWLAGLKTIQTAVNLSLRLIRQSSAPQSHVASAGFFQTGLDANLPSQLIRVGVPETVSAYPETSVGRHGVSIRFYHLNLTERALPVHKEVKFQMTICVF